MELHLFTSWKKEMSDQTPWVLSPHKTLIHAVHEQSWVGRHSRQRTRTYTYTHTERERERGWGIQGGRGVSRDARGGSWEGKKGVLSGDPVTRGPFTCHVHTVDGEGVAGVRTGVGVAHVDQLPM